MKNRKTLRLTELGLFTGLILLLTLTPLGYIKTGGLSIALVVIPVAVGAALLGKGGGAFLGGVFGVTSFFQFLLGDAFAQALISLSPVRYFILCVPTRILVGFLAGLFADLILGRKGDVNVKSDKKRESTAAFVASLCTPLLNTLFFMSALVLFFWKSEPVQGWVTSLGVAGKGVLTFIVTVIAVNFVSEVVSCIIIGTAISIAMFTVSDRMGK